MSEKKTTTQHRGGPMGGGPGRNIGFSVTCRNALSLSLPSSF